MTTTFTRGFDRSELVDLAYYYVRAGGRDTDASTAEQLLDSAVDSMIGRTVTVGSPERSGEDAEHDVPDERIVEDGDVEIVRAALVEAVALVVTAERDEDDGA